MGETNIDAIVARALERVRPAYLSREQLAEELDITVKTVRRMEKDGLPIHHLGGALFRFVRTEVEEWMKARESTDGTR